MDCYHSEPRLSDMFADPIVRTMMVADHVDPEALAACLRKTARKVAPQSAPADQHA